MVRVLIERPLVELDRFLVIPVLLRIDAALVVFLSRTLVNGGNAHLAHKSITTSKEGLIRFQPRRKVARKQDIDGLSALFCKCTRPPRVKTYPARADKKTAPKKSYPAPIETPAGTMTAELYP